jgi:polysaccharide biosynthesis protein PslG
MLIPPHSSVGRSPFFLLICLSVFLVAPGHAAAREQPSLAAAQQSVYFPETRFWVDPLFFDFWSTHGGLMTFGYPISRVFYQDGLHRQYFERAIFERHENYRGTPYEVLLTRLGAANTVSRRGDAPFLPQQIDRQITSTGGRYFPETGHHLEGVFLDYWLANGGLRAFGYPLSEQHIELGRDDGAPHLVQYFERSRFEYHPEHAGTRFEVLLGHLGHEALARRQVPAVALEPQSRTDGERQGVIGPLPVGEPSPVACGFNLAFWSDDDRLHENLYYLDMAQATGCRWIRLQFNWDSMQPTRLTQLDETIYQFIHVVEAAKARDMQVLVNVSHAPAWALTSDPRQPADEHAFGLFMGQLVTGFGGLVDAWQLWNEPNLVAETNGLIDPAGFYPLLKAGYVAVKVADPDALVVFPGLAPCSLMDPHLAMDNIWYLESILAINDGEAANYFDVLAIHTYGAGNHPDTYWPGNLADNPGWTTAPEFYFRSAERVRNVLVNAGLSHIPIWITEIGWPVGAYADTWGYGRWITEDLQAEYLLRAFEIMRTEWHWVDLGVIWHLNFAEYGGRGNAFTGFSVIRADRQPRLAYDAVRQMNADPQLSTLVE